MHWPSTLHIQGFGLGERRVTINIVMVCNIIDTSVNDKQITGL